MVGSKRKAGEGGARARTPAVTPPPAEKPAHVKETPLPWGQLSILCVVLLTESICSTVLIPFTPSFVAHLQGWKIEDAGYVAGFPVGLFMLGQVISGKLWSSVSDKVGRVIGIEVGVAGCAICMFLFGLSGSFYEICFWRFVHGLVAGCSIIAKTMINDLTDTTNRAKGLALVSLTWGVGTLFGPAVGGLYDPVNGPSSPFHNWFSKTGFFARYPAFLPSLIVASYNLFADVISVLFLHESNKMARPLREVLPASVVRVLGPVIDLIQPKLPCQEAVEITVTTGEEGTAAGRVAGTKAATTAPPPLPPPAAATSPVPHHSFGFKQALQNPLLRRVLIISMLISFSDMTFAQIFPLWCAAPTTSGGLGLNPSSIAVLVLANSVPAVCANIVFAKVIQLSGGPLRLWIVSQIAYGVLTCLIPIATSMSPTGGFYFSMVIGMVRKVTECWSFGLIMLVVSMTAPQGKVGMMFGIQQSTACMVRCFVPFIFAPVFAWSIRAGHVFPLNHYFTFLLCMIPLAISAYMTNFIYIPSVDGADQEELDIDSEDVAVDAESNARRSGRGPGLGSGRGSVRSHYSFFGNLPASAAERETLLLNNSFANLANSFATNIISGMPQNTILAVPVGAPLQLAGEAEETGLQEPRRDSGDSRDASSQEGDEVDPDAEYASMDEGMVPVRPSHHHNHREREDRRMTERGNTTEDEELPG